MTEALRNPRAALKELDRLDCRDSLLTFVKKGWKVLEPETEFVTGWAIEAMAAHLEAVTRGDITRLLINVPPGFTKSMLTNVFWPAWEWGPRGKSSHRFISASYEKNLATRDLVRCRDLIMSQWFQELWPLKMKDDQDQKTYYETTNRGWRLASSVGGALTGYRGDRIIVDDPHNVRSAESDAERFEALRWFTETLPTRLNKQKESAIVLIMQRLHERDCSGLVLEELKDRWTSLILPMEHEVDRTCKTKVIYKGRPFEDPRKEEGELLWPERFGREAVDELKQVFRAHGGSYAEAAQLQQRPAPRGGGMFKRDDFNVVEHVVPGRRVRAWDLAASKEKDSAYTVGVKLCITSEKRLIIEDVVRFKGLPHEVKSMILKVAKQDGRNVPISIPQDPGQAGKAQRADFAAALHGYIAHFSPESGDKEVRAMPVAAQVGAGTFSILRAPWNEPFLAEVAMFPAGRYKDQVDALSRAYSYLIRNSEDVEIGIPGLVVFEEDL